MALRKFLILVALGVITIFIAAAWVFPPTDDFNAANPLWNGASDISSTLPVLQLSSLQDLSTPTATTTLILIPYLSYTPGELNLVYNLANHGITLVIADDYGYGNQLLERLGLNARFSGNNLLDPLMNYKNQWFPKIYRFSDNPITRGCEYMVFNHATTLTDVKANEIIGQSSSMSFLDINGNGTHDNNEPMGPLPVISQHILGSGKVILIADSSIFINSMEGQGNNNILIQNLATPSKSGIYLDHSHLPQSNLVETKKILKQIHDFISNPTVTVLLVIVLLIAILLPMSYGGKWFDKRAKKRESSENGK